MTSSAHSARAYDRQQRFLLCDRCGAPIEVPADGGHAACGYCGAPLDLRMRVEAAVTAEAPPTERERIELLRAQDPRFVPPPAIAPLFAGTALAPTREREAYARWQQLRSSLRSAAAHEMAAQLFFLTTGLAGRLLERGELLRQRALVESALEVLTSPRHQQLLRAMLARSACRAGDHAAASAWLDSCDDRSADLHADTAYRFGRAYLATARAQFGEVAKVLGTGSEVPLSAAYDAECLVLCAAAWEQLGHPAMATDVLLRAYQGLSPLARPRAERFLSAHADWGLCRASAPEVIRRAAALTPKPPHEAGTGTTVVLGMAGYCTLWSLLAIAAIPVAVMTGDGVGLGGLALSLFTGGLLAIILGPLGLRSRAKLRARRRLFAHGTAHAAWVVAATARPDPMFQQEGLLAITLDLLVTPDDATAYRTSCTVSATAETAPFFATGAALVLRVDPHDPSQQLVDVG